MKNNLKTKIYLSLFIFLIFVSIFSGFFIYPLWKEIKVKSKELVLIKEKLSFLEKELKNINELKKMEEKIKMTKEKIELLFINTETPLEFISFLETLSRECQISLNFSSLSSKERLSENWPSLKFQISLLGSFPNVARFLEKLENSPFLIRIESLQIIHLTENELALKEFEKFKLGDVKVNLLLKVYGK